MDQKYVNVPVRRIEKGEVVVDLGGGFFVNLVGLEKNILLKINEEGSPYKLENYFKRVEQRDEMIGKYNDAISQNRLYCYIPLEPGSTHGGRQSKVRRPPPRRRRATRRTTRRR
jgi:hypothetical protein